MTILLDSSVIIDFLRSRRGRREYIARLAEGGDDLACSAMSVAEVYAGMKPGEAEVTEEFLQSLKCIDMSYKMARRAGELKYQWARKGQTIDVPDAVIAAAALEFNLSLATDNRKDFPMPGLTFAELPEA
jgi:predicted nucleic acid-binding protein